MDVHERTPDAEDARICCLLALDQHAGLRPLVPQGDLGSELRSIARDDERAARDQLRLLNRLRADLIVTYPAAIALASSCSGSLGSLTILRLLQAWPNQDDLAGAGRQDLVEFARGCRHGWPERLADNIAAALARPALPVQASMVRAKTAGIRLAAAQLLALHTARREWEQRMGELLIGASTSHGRRRARTSPAAVGSAASEAAHRPVPAPEPEPTTLPGGSIYLSFPRLGDRLACRIAGEIGEDIRTFASPNALQSYAGTGPVTRRSGKRDHVVAQAARRGADQRAPRQGTAHLAEA